MSLLFLQQTNRLTHGARPFRRAPWPKGPLESRGVDDLSARLGGQGSLDNRANVVVQEMPRAVAEDPVPPAGMLAPVVMRIAAIGLESGPEPLVAPRA